MLPPRAPKDRKLPRKPKVPRRCQGHRKWIIGFACSACGKFGTETNPIEAAHIRLGTGGGTSLKPSDRWLVSLCHNCHVREQHQKGERTFWSRRGINDPKALADEFARKSPYWPKLREMP